MASPDFTVRPATAADVPALGRLGGALMRLHHHIDPDRFMMRPDPEAGYAWFLETQVRDPRVCVLVAEAGGQVVGYVYAGVEPLDWMELREECGFVHDVLVDEAARGHGIGGALLEAAIAWLHERKMPRVVLWTAHGNEPAAQLFARHGFRTTMLEMTRELD